MSTFAAFLTRAFDQIRMSQYSSANLKLVGSHAGVSIGEDGPSQMALEDLAMFRAVNECVVLYPADAVATERLVECAAEHSGMVYLRTTRAKTPVIYSPQDEFVVGGSKVVRSSGSDAATVMAAGITLHEALAAADRLAAEGLAIRVVDLYSVKPLDHATVLAAARETGAVVVVEDHWAEGGLGEAVASVLVGTPVRFRSLAVTARPKSGTPAELLAFEGIDRDAIADAVHALV